MKQCVLSPLVLGILLVGLPARSAEPTKKQCVEANDAAQDLRQARKLRQAREKLVLCSAASCPGIVREDCVQRLSEVDAAMPSIIFEAKDAAGSDLSAVTVTLDGAPLAEKLDGAPLRVDPGEHVFVLAPEGRPSVTKKLVLAEHEQGRRELILLGTTEAPRSPAASPVAGTGMSTLRLAGLIGGGAGVAGLVVGGIFGLVASSKWSSAKTDCGAGCGPTAPAQQEKSSAQSAATVSTVSFVLGGALAAGGLALFLMAPSRSESAAWVQFVPAVGARGGGVLLRGGF